MYATVAEAEVLLDGGTSSWFTADDTDKERALKIAASVMDENLVWLVDTPGDHEDVQYVNAALADLHVQSKLFKSGESQNALEVTRELGPLRRTHRYNSTATYPTHSWIEESPDLYALITPYADKRHRDNRVVDLYPILS